MLKIVGDVEEVVGTLVTSLTASSFVEHGAMRTVIALLPQHAW